MNSKKVIISIGAVVAILVALLINFLFTRPVYRFNKAIDKGDLSKAAELLDQVGQDNYDIARSKVMIKFGEISDAYISDSISYDDALNQISVFDNTSMAADDSYNLIKEGITKVKNSKEAWVNANEAYDAKDYYKAIDEYSKVIVTDANYSIASERIEECNEEILKTFCGTWYCDIDLGIGLLKANDMTQYGEDVSLPMAYEIEFSQDGKAVMSMVSDSFEEDLRQYVDNICEVALNYIASQQNVSVSQLKQESQNVYGMPFNDYIYMSFKCDKVIDIFRNSRLVYEYRYEGGKIILSADQEETECDIDNGDLLFNKLNSRAQKALELLNIEFPLRFIKGEKRVAESETEGSAE